MIARPCWDPGGGDATLPFGKSNPACVHWPAYSSSESSVNEPRRRLSEGIDQAIQRIHHATGRLSAGDIDHMLSRRCVSRQCLRVQILQRKVLVVAPHSRRCNADDRIAGDCSASARQRTDGVAASDGGKVGKWDRQYSPTQLHWHFAAGVNVSDCRATIIAGDFNGAFTRLRLTTSLRLLEEAASAGVVDDTELLLCLQETPINAGSWCLRGPQPLFAMTSNEEAPLLALPHWLPRLRDVDFALWDNARKAATRDSAARTESLAKRARKAVFRGGLYRLSVYSNRWREEGVRKALLTSDNWHALGRGAVLHAMASAADKDNDGQLIDAHVSLGPYAERLRIDEKVQRSMPLPAAMSLAEQQARFRYVLNIEGHGGWADRLAKLQLSPMLVIAQDVAPRLWFESALQNGHTHLVVVSIDLLEASRLVVGDGARRAWSDGLTVCSHRG